MKLFIIGNGFDRGHDLATSYWDFRTYLNSRHPEFLCSFEENYDIYPRWDESAKKEMLWNELETNLANIKEDDIVDQAVSIDMNLESGDVGIEDTLYYHFNDQYKYIEFLTKYIKEWIKSVRINDIKTKTSLINNERNSLYISFNYTTVLETIYKIDERKITHIHGSILENDEEPVLGHGNISRIEKIKEKRNEAENLFSEKETSIYRVIENYYGNTFKNINRYIPKLEYLADNKINEILVIGHSFSGVDVPYFKCIDDYTFQNAKWKVFFHSERDNHRINENLQKCGVHNKRIEMLHSKDFFDL